MSRSVETCRDFHVAMMMSPERWLWHPFLPLKRAIEGREVELGVLYDAWGCSGLPGYSATVFCWLCGDPHKTSYAEFSIMQSRSKTAHELGRIRVLRYA